MRAGLGAGERLIEQCHGTARAAERPGRPCRKGAAGDRGIVPEGCQMRRCLPRLVAGDGLFEVGERFLEIPAIDRGDLRDPACLNLYGPVAALNSQSQEP
jgi:hypothetical protein